ncbi:MAG TPA: hypothetical protein VID48_12975, partial [Solirubrobacteraceae bacterium]
MHSPEPDQTRRAARPPRVPGHEHLTLEDGWELARCAPDACGPSELERLQWQAIPAPSTVAQALRQLGRWQLGDSEDFDAHDWWFRTRFQALPARPGEEVALCLDGLASVAEVYLNGERLLDSASMFKAHEIDVTKRLLPENELLIHCRALGELLRARRTPRARWRTRLVANGNLRFFRTMLLGRAPGFAPAPAAVGPWRPVRLERRSEVRIDRLALRTRLCGADGVLEVQMGMRTLSKDAVNEVTLELSGPSGSHRCVLELAAQEGSASGELVIPAVARWWPHTHGDPALHDVHLHVSGPHGQITIPAGRVGFRELAPGSDPAHRIEADGLDLHLNGVRIFARGAVWTPLDLAAPEASEAALRSALEQVCEAGMNMLRIPGTSAYETPAFHDLCDELGLLVWQDFMFANMDYPIADEQFREEVLSEVEQVLEQAAGRPSLTVLCGNSEVEQQVAMLGLDPAIARGELFGDLLPELIAASGL